MFPYHPAAEYVCRHCGGNAGNAPEVCIHCGPICGPCLNKPGKCAGQIAHEEEMASEKVEQEEADNEK